MISLLVATLGAGLTGPARTAASGTFTILPTDDAYVSSASSTANFGSATVLEVGSSPSLHSYLRFDLAGISGSISIATLRLHAGTSGSGSSIHLTSAAWSEGGITYGTAPAYGSTIASVSGFSSGTWISFNVTSLMSGSGVIAFAFTSASSTPIFFASREDAVNAPQLVITTTGSSGGGGGGGTVTGLRRAPYLTDVSATTATVNVATDASSPAPVVNWGPADGTCAAPPSSTTAVSVTSFSGPLSGTTDYQFKAALSGLEADTSYCYRVMRNGGDLIGSATTFTTAPDPVGSVPFSFGVIGDWGAGTSDEAKIFTQIAVAKPGFLVTVGDNTYTSGTQLDYGDLNGGKVFAPAYLPKLGGGTPIFAAQGNHGFTSYGAYLANFPQDAVARASGGTYRAETYCCAAGTSGTKTYASTWYAFGWANARFYVLEAAWADGNGAYQGDFSDHWSGSVTGCTPCGQELAWLQADLAANTLVPLKFAFFHYPLHADSSGQPSDSYLNGPDALEGLLARNGVDIVYNGHAHQYERNFPQIAGTSMVSYVTGGGGAQLGGVGGCSSFDAYAIGSASSCHAPKPTSNSQVFHFLLVSVNGNRVTVTPTDETGRTFDVQTYTFAP